MGFWEEFFWDGAALFLGLLIVAGALYGPTLLIFGIVELWQWIF